MSEAMPVRVQVPIGGEKITIMNGKLHVPNQPIIPFIEGDGTGRDIWRASVRVFDAAVLKAFGGKRKITTVEMKINYFRPFSEGRIFARSRLLRIGSTLSVGSVDLTDTKGNVIGAAIVTYMFLDAREKNAPA